MAVVNQQFREKIVTFGAGKGLVGVLTIPAQPRARAPQVVLVNSGIIHRVGAHRLYVGFARAFAAAGMTTLRFDLSGIGDSERQSGTFSLEDSVARDIAAALDLLGSENGGGQFILGGLCSGAFDSFEYALRDSRVVGAVMIDMPGPFRNWSYVLRHVAVRVHRVASWRTLAKQLIPVVGAPVEAIRLGRDRREAVSMIGVRKPIPGERMKADLNALLARNVRLAFIFTGGVSDYYNHRSQFALRFPRAAAHRALTVELVNWTNHTFNTRKARAYVTGFLRDWLVDKAS